MAFGFPASYSTQIEFVGQRQNARDAVEGIFETLDWTYSNDSLDVYRVTMPMNALSWGETLTVTLTKGLTVVTSECSFPLQLFDWGKNKRNVQEFVERFMIRQTREAKIHNEDPIFLDDKGRTPVERIFIEKEQSAD